MWIFKDCVFFSGYPKVSNIERLTIVFQLFYRKEEDCRFIFAGFLFKKILQKRVGIFLCVICLFVSNSLKQSYTYPVLWHLNTPIGWQARQHLLKIDLCPTLNYLFYFCQLSLEVEKAWLIGLLTTLQCHAGSSKNSSNNFIRHRLQKSYFIKNNMGNS